VAAGEREAKMPASFTEMLSNLRSLDSEVPRMGQFFDEQIKRWLTDLQKSPRNVYLLNNVGSAYLGRGNIDEAIRYFQEALEVDERFVSARANLAKAYMMQDKLEEALEIYLGDSNSFPSDARPMMNLAHVYLRQGKLVQAGETIDQVLSLEPDSFAAHHNRGVVHLLEGKVDRAISEFRKSVSLDARFAAAYNALGVCYAVLGNYRKAVKYLLASHATDSSDTSATKNLAMVYQLKGDFAAAATVMETYLDNYCRDWEARNIAAFSYFRLAEYKRALSHLEYLRINSDTLSLGKDRLAAVLNNIGVVCQHMGLTSQAEEMYRNAMATWAHPSSVTYFNFAKLCVELGKQRQAKRLLDQYTSIETEDEAALILLSRYHCNQDEYDTAEELLVKVLDINPESRDARVLLSMIYCEALDDYDRAIEISKQGLDLNPRDQGFLNNLAYSYLRKGLIHEAKTTLDRIGWDKAYFFAYATKGLLRISQGRVSEGASLYDKAANIAPNPEWKQLVRQKKRIEVARYWVSQGKTAAAVRHLHVAKSIRTKSQVFAKQAGKLLARIEGSD
jgi:tetratricopeptide (TPR) repeat protein